MFIVRRLVLVAWITTKLLCAQTVDDTTRVAQEQEAQQKLEQVRTEIKAIGEQLRAIQAQRGEASKTLRDKELAISSMAKELRGLDDKLAAEQAKLTTLEKQQAGFADKLTLHRDALAALLRSAYIVGRNQEIKLLLQQENVSMIGRVLAYHRYFQNARITQIQQLLDAVKQLSEAQEAVRQQTTALTVTKVAQEQKKQQLSSERDDREKLLVELNAQFNDSQERLAALGKDEKTLTELLKRLRDIFADIPKQLTGAEPFVNLRGRLSWPLQGKRLTHPAGTGEAGQSRVGVMIAAKSGSEVHAISHGRVAFADWFKGYGLLMIIDHGDGYMSLYGYNEALLKSAGDWVNLGDVIATSGASGGQKTAGLYFELRSKGQPIDLRAWFK